MIRCRTDPFSLKQLTSVIVNNDTRTQTASVLANCSSRGRTMSSLRRLSFLRRATTQPLLYKQCFSQAAAAIDNDPSRPGKRVVFLGTPEISAFVLDKIVQASTKDRTFEVVGIVSKPPTPSGRGKKLTKCPVQLYGENAGIPVLTPLKATEEPFLQQLHLMQPDLCITASYGNYLPKKFLAIPKFGTLNIHPSLLPKWRGAAPVQRSLENGDRLVGVTVLFTVQKMDAGPVVTQSAIQLTGDESFPAVLKTLMDIGTDNLLSVLPDLWAGTVHQHEQDEAAVTEAPKFDNSDAFVDFRVLTAREAHNRCRALSGTFGTWCSFEIVDDSLLKIDGSMRVNIISTIVLNEGDGSRNHNGNNKVEFVRNPNPAEKGNILGISCRGGSLLGVTAVQPATKRVMTARDFLNGIKSNKSIFWVGPE